MGKINDAFKDGRIVGGVVAVSLAAVLGVGVVNVATAQQPAAVVETTAPASTIDLASTPYTNGLASEQESEAAAIEQARLAAEAEAARVAAEQAAAAEAARIAAEQAAAAEQQAAEAVPEADPEPSDPDPGTGGGGGGGLPSGAVPPNVAGTDQPDSTACASSALTWDGTQSVCA